jgi:AcrR family transcriptional regulator
MSHILERARALFVELGFARTTMDEITERLNISKLFIY